MFLCPQKRAVINPLYEKLELQITTIFIYNITLPSINLFYCTRYAPLRYIIRPFE